MVFSYILTKTEINYERIFLVNELERELDEGKAMLQKNPYCWQ